MLRDLFAVMTKCILMSKLKYLFCKEQYCQTTLNGAMPSVAELNSGFCALRWHLIFYQKLFSAFQALTQASANQTAATQLALASDIMHGGQFFQSTWLRKKFYWLFMVQ